MDRVLVQHHTSSFLTAASFVVALDGTRRFQQGPGRSHKLIPAGVLLLLAIPPIWDYSTTGLESGLQSLWLATCWWLMVRTRSVLRLPSLVLMFVVIGLGPLVRPNLGLFPSFFSLQH
jgi:arabinofuranosyltransferase